MATTTNFGWQTPDDTDLVKDGAAAIRTLGSSIDTSLVDLKGGTTGQILSKNSNTDLDYTWINNDQGDITEITASSPLTGGGTTGAITVGIQDGTTAQKGAIQLEDSTSSTSTTKAATPNSVKSAYDLANGAIAKSLVDAAGDLIYGTGDNTVARLAIGTAGQVLKVNSGATAPEWVAAGGGGGLVFLSRTTFSNVASQAFTDVFDSSYETYFVNIEDISAATLTDDLQLQLRYGSTTQTAGYYGSSIYGGYAQAVSQNQTSNLAHFTIAVDTGNSTYGGTGHIYFSRIGNTTERSLFYGRYLDAYNINHYTFGGINGNPEPYTGFVLKSSSSNITGQVAIYGLAKS